MEKERSSILQPARDYRSKSDKIMAKVCDVLNPAIVLIDGAVAGAKLAEGHEYAALVYGLIGLFFLGNTALRSLEIRKARDNLWAEIESQKTPVEDYFKMFE